MKFDDGICKGISCPECSFNKGEDGCLLAKRLDEIEIIPEPCEDAVSKIKNASFTGSDGLDYVETLVALDALNMVRRQAAIDSTGEDAVSRADVKEIVSFECGEWRGLAKTIIDKLEALPSAQPELDEWCTDCKEYDQERHCCPRWNKVIRQTLKDVQPESCEDVKFWRKRAEYYSKMCFDLIADINKGVKIDSVEINEDGIKFTKKQQEPCEDAVSRQQAIEVADAVWTVTGDKNVAKVWQQIKDLPSVTPKMRWIPCHPSKLLKNMPLWATFDDGDGYRYVEKVFWDMTEWNRDVSNVIAYMPYEEPEPYREEGGK